MVLKGHAEYAPRTGEDLGGIEPRLQPPSEVLHPRLIPAVEPAHQGLAVLQGGEPGDPGAVEAGFQRPRFEEVGGHPASISFKTMFVRLKHCLAALNIVCPSQTMFGSQKQCLGAFFIVWEPETMF